MSMPRIIREGAAGLKPVACAATALALAACGGKEGGMPEPATPPTWVERVASARVPGVAPPPLLVLLHGIGADEFDLFPLAGMVDPRFRVVSLRAPFEYVVGYAWFHIEFGADGTIRPNVDQAATALRDLVRWIEAAPARHGTDPAKTYLLGFSQGAMMSLGVLGRTPHLLAGVVALSGRDPAGLFPPSTDQAAMGRVPLFLAHGLYDDILPVANGRRTRDALASISSDFTYREYPVAHGVSDDEMGDVAAWLTERLDRQSRAGS